MEIGVFLLQLSQGPSSLARLHPSRALPRQYGTGRNHRMQALWPGQSYGLSTFHCVLWPQVYGQPGFCSQLQPIGLQGLSRHEWAWVCKPGA
ncbi:hypothetical protein VTN96DRAFT_5267 [Rasamsonia emersonii]